MAGYTKIGSTVKQLTTVYGKVGGVVKELKAGWVKEGGVLKRIWGTPVPDNMVILYSNTSHIPSDATIQTAWNNRFPLSATSSLTTTGGSNSHTGADHGDVTDAYGGTNKTSTYTTPTGIQDQWFFANGISAESSSHYHTISHTHSTTAASHVPEYFTLIPTLGSEIIGPNAVFPAAASLSVSGWTQLYAAYIKYYLRFSSSNSSTGGASTHQHESYSGETSRFTDSEIVNSSYLRAYYWPFSHVHDLTHQHAAEDNDPLYIDLDFWKPGKYIWTIDDIPTGTVCFFTSGTIPTGWTVYTLSNGRLLRQRKSTDSLEGVGGRSTTEMTPISKSVSGTTGYAAESEAEYNASGTRKRIEYGHSHYISHSHDTAVSLLPKWVKLYVAIKE